MTDKTETELQRLLRTEAGLHKALSDLTDALTGKGEGADPPEKIARSISTVMKALDDIAEKRERIEARERAKKYTRYEDLPPPSPEDEARFHAEFKRLFNSIIDRRGTGVPVLGEPPASSSVVSHPLSKDGAQPPESP